MSIVTPPFIPAFGTGAPGAGVPTNTLYFDTSASPYQGYAYHSGAWHTFGGTGGGGVNATQLQGVAIKNPLTTTNGFVLEYVSANSDLELVAPPGSAPFHPGYVSGRWYYSPCTFGGISVGNSNANTLYAVPFYCGVATTFTKIGLLISSGTAGNAELGIYNNDGNGGLGGQPGTLFQDCGHISTATSGGISLTGLTINLPAGWSWMVVGASATVQVSTYVVGNFTYFWEGNGGLSNSPTGGGINGSWTYAANSLPSTFPTITYGGSQPLIVLGV